MTTHRAQTGQEVPIQRWTCEPLSDWKQDDGRYVRYDDHLAALAAARADNEAMRKLLKRCRLALTMVTTAGEPQQMFYAAHQALRYFPQQENDGGKGEAP